MTKPKTFTLPEMTKDEAIQIILILAKRYFTEQKHKVENTISGLLTP